MRYIRTRMVTLGTLAALPLWGGCVSGQPMVAGQPAPKLGDGGILVAESKLARGTTAVPPSLGRLGDCGGPGLGIQVEGSAEGGKYLYDVNGEPCEAAQMLFDGTSQAGSRMADPGIALTFHDTLGPLPEDEIAGLMPIPDVRVSSELLDQAEFRGIAKVGDRPDALAPSTKELVVARRKEAGRAPGPDPLLAKLNRWQAKDKVAEVRMLEEDSAAARNIENIAKEARDRSEQEGISTLAAQLRERERQVEDQQRRHAETLERAAESREQTAAARQAWQQKEDELRAELEATRQRLAQFEQLASRLRDEKAKKEQAYRDKIYTLSSDLKVAEEQAQSSRRNLILEAAAKIAEAEQLAKAAQLQEQDMKLREAARLKSEAEEMMDRALAIKAGRQVVVSREAAPPAADMPLEEVPITLHARNQTLEDLVAGILKQAEPKAGEWRADWQLGGKSGYILKEKWSLTAEAPLEQVLEQLTEQVKAAHGITLKFTRFSQSRLLVVTDTQGKSKN